MTRTVLVPSSLTRDASDKREATRKLGYIARTAAVFRIDRLTIYHDTPGEGTYGGTFIQTVLDYAATPPYLRKTTWGKRDELEYAGILPPLKLSTRTGSGSDDSESLRSGIVTEVGSDNRVRVNCGLQHPISLIIPDRMTLTEGERVTVSISSRRPIRARIVNLSPPGYTVDTTDLETALSREDAGIGIATSRFGDPLTLGRLTRLAPTCTREGFTLAFGAPERGLPEILGVTPGDTKLGFDHWLNTIPHQGSETVRTEEAMIASLATLTLTE